MLAAWLQVSVLPVRAKEWWDNVLSRYVCWLAEEAYDLAMAFRTVSAVLWGFPALGRPTRSVLPRTAQSLRGWSVLAPGRSRPPLPRILLEAIALHLVRHQDPLMALNVVMIFEAYLRPSESLALRAFQLVPPVEGEAAAAFLTLLLHAKELEIPSKTGAWDVSVPLDLDRQLFLVPMLLAIKHSRGATQLLWSHDYPQLAEAFRVAAKAVGVASVGPSLYWLRHGGPSHDYALGLRDLQAIQLRGGWRSFSSVQRYQKSGRLNVTLSRLGVPMVEQLQRMTRNFAPSFTEFFWKRSGLPRPRSDSCLP